MITYLLTRHLQPSQTFVANEVAELRRQGVQVDVVSLERGAVVVPGVTYLNDLSRGRGRVVSANAVQAWRAPRRYARFLARAWAYRSELGRGPNEVRWYLLPLLLPFLAASGARSLHAHFAWSGAAAADLLSALTGLPWSVTLHANDIFSEQRNLRRKLSDADHLVTVCRYNEEWMRKHLGLVRPVHQVICGVEVPEEPWPYIAGADVVAVGRLVPKKGFDVLIRSMALLRHDLPDITLDIVGEGPCRPELEALVTSLQLEETVRLLGARDHDEALARIAGGRVFALPCRIAEDGDRDSMPVVIKEAMVREVPVVASDVVAIPEMLDDGCGMLIPPDDPAALAAALLYLLQDPDAAAQVARRGRERVLQRFTLQGEVTKLRTLLLGETQLTRAPERFS